MPMHGDPDLPSFMTLRPFRKETTWVGTPHSYCKRENVQVRLLVCTFLHRTNVSKKFNGKEAALRQLGKMLCGGDRYHLKPKCEAGWIGHAVDTSGTRYVVNVQRFSMGFFFVFHVTWRPSPFHRIPSKCGEGAWIPPRFMAAFWRTKKSPVYEIHCQDHVCFAWNSDETLHDQDVKVSVEGSKWPNWPTGQWKCFKRNLPIFIFGTSAWKSLEDEGARCTLTLSEAFSGFAKSVFGLNSVVTLTNLSQNNAARNPRFQPRWLNPIVKSLPFHPRRCSASFASFWRKIQIKLFSGTIDQPESLECRGSAELHGTVCFHSGSPGSNWCHLRFTGRDIELLCSYFGWNCWPFSKKGLENEVTWIWQWNLRNPQAFTLKQPIFTVITHSENGENAAIAESSNFQPLPLGDKRSNHAVSSSLTSKKIGKLKASFTFPRILRAPHFWTKIIHSRFRPCPTLHSFLSFSPTLYRRTQQATVFWAVQKKNTVAASSRNAVTRDVSLNPASPSPENLWVSWSFLCDSPKVLFTMAIFTRETLIFVWMVFMVCMLHFLDLGKIWTLWPWHQALNPRFFDSTRSCKAISVEAGKSFRTWRHSQRTKGNTSSCIFWCTDLQFDLGSIIFFMGGK